MCKILHLLDDIELDQSHRSLALSRQTLNFILIEPIKILGSLSPVEYRLSLGIAL
jgi:hypothetical protein